jgi:hypothetical protein
MEVREVALGDVGERAGPLLDTAPATTIQVSTIDQDPDQVVLPSGGQLADAVIQHEQSG